jgi:Raf kinase inhibitor-like YbhB/YbcL family protein
LALKVTSALFADGGALPDSAVFNGFGLTGGNVSPDLTWGAGPAGTKSYAVTCYDPDAPTTVGFRHWLAMDICMNGHILDQCRLTAVFAR